MDVLLFQLLQGKFAKELSHETDGLIFNPAKAVSKICFDVKCVSLVI